MLVQLSRNFGMEVAMSAGLDHAPGDHVVLMHADLQDPPELIPEMLETARKGADVVYARRIGRDESWLKRSLATAFYSLMERLARTPYQGQAGDFRLMSRRVVDTLREMPERRRFLRGMVAWVGYEQVPIEYRRAGRRRGPRRLLPPAAAARRRGAGLVLRRTARAGRLLRDPHRDAVGPRGGGDPRLHDLRVGDARASACGSSSRSSSSAACS